MSRILDALKKAEEEKLTQTSSPETLRADAPLVSGNGDQEHAATLNGGAKATFEGQVGKREATVATLLEACPRHDWNADSSHPREADSHRDPLVSEVFRSLRSHLSLMRKRQPLQKLLITSAVPQEGKTFVAANLAQTFAKQHDSRVLLIDGDLRVSALHKVLGVPLAPGLSEYLSGAAELDSVLRRGSPDNFFFITGGERPTNPTELLGNGRFELLMNRLGPAFEWIILDSPPAVPVSDARLLAQFCDGVLMLVRAGVTPVDLAQKACQEFPKGQILGVVLNRAAAQPGYGAYDYYGGAS
jgi:protein-tyrosine kinase